MLTKSSSVLRFIDNLFLNKIDKTVNYLFKNHLNDQEKNKDSHNYKCNLTTLKSKAIPFEYNIHSVKDDTITLEKVINEKEKQLGDKNWSGLDIYWSILKAFKEDYLRYVLLTLVLIILDAFVKYKGIIYIGALIGTRQAGNKEIGFVSSLVIFVLKATFLLSDTHLKYYIMRVRARVIGAINGVSLLRLSKCDSNSCLNQNQDSEQLPKSKISRYQNVITVDSEFSENAISYSIRIFILPLRIASTFAIAVKTLDNHSVKLLIFSLSFLFSGAVLSLFISTLFKKPFIAHRERRIAETTNIIENSRPLNLTQDHFISTYHNLLSESRRNEMRFGSFRKYFFTIEEIISRSMNYLCYGIISIYVWYNRFDTYKSIEMIIDSAILVPSFYTPLQELCYLIYYISEGNNALNRLAELMQITKSQLLAETITPKIIGKNESIVLHTDSAQFDAFSSNKIEIKYGMPVIFSCNDISYNYLLTDLLRRVVFGVNGRDGIRIELVRRDIFGVSVEKDEYSNNKNSSDANTRTLNVLADISNPVCYVPVDSWITDGMSLADIILNGRDYDRDSWERVLDICELRNDFLSWGILSYELARSTIFSQVQFSRGQKVRLSLSRALYGIASRNDESNYIPGEGVPILVLDSIFASLDPPVCCSILEKLFNKESGLLNNVFSMMILETQMLNFLPGNILESVVHLIPFKDTEKRSFCFNDQTPKSTTSINTSSSINSIINDFCLDTDFSKDLWELSTEEDEIFNLSSNSNSNDGEATDNQTNLKYEKGAYTEFNSLKKGEEQTEELIELLPKKGVANSSPENSYSTLFFYILKAANRFRYQENWSIKEKIQESSLEMVLYLALLLLHQFILLFGEKVLFGNLSRVSETGSKIGGILGVDILYFTYFVCIALAILSVVASGILEVYVGLRAANNLHNSFLLGYIGSKLSSCIRYIPVSFVLNRISLDQLTIDYCTTKRIGQFVTAVNRVLATIYLSILASEYPVIQIILFSMFFYVIYKYVFRYFIHSCRLIHNTYISEISLLVDTVRNICDGKECIQPQKLDKFYLENGYDQLQEIMKPIYIQSSLETWLKIRLQAGIIIPLTFLNIFSSYFSNESSKVLIALMIATAFSSLSRVDEVVRYLMRLERELVSVERMRKYLELIKDEYAMRNNLFENNEKCDNQILNTSMNIGRGNNNINVVLESAYGYHSNLSLENEKSQLDRSEVRGTLVKQVCCLSNINVVANKGEIIGIVGRSGSGKTSLLFLIAKSLKYKGKVNHLNSISYSNNLSNNNHLVNCKLCRNNLDENIMRIFLEDYNMMKHIAMLPVEVFFNENTTIRQSVDPFENYSDDNIISALNICGVTNYLLERVAMSNLDNKINIKNSFGEGKKQPDESTLLMSNDKFTVINNYLNRKISELSLPMQIQRLLLFTHYFLKRNEISILLIDEPPVIYCKDNMNITSNKKSTLITNIIFKYFSHTTTFIVAHDIRNLNGIKKFWYLHKGTLTIKRL
ncbi:ABC transporter [Cryptosporidium sp. chipmunk genotype I]|uniref:ABC transporter n=1 Tax=Cryptosporidium sp. chipmunk genotype I TaxID=1280935 RepID=UPI00351A2CCF|nr:ABC transporter [Cryptosporidium sp. chipmunk genotype I]